MREGGLAAGGGVRVGLGQGARSGRRLQLGGRAGAPGLVQGVRAGAAWVPHPRHQEDRVSAVAIQAADQP
eukprot:7573986-Pyramimonas_sp.AAC.1